MVPPPKLHLLLFFLGHPSFVAVAAADQCFADDDELQTAVDQYIDQNCTTANTCDVGQIYGTPMNSWCVANVTDMTKLFSGKSSFNEEISAWDVSSVTKMEKCSIQRRPSTAI